MKNLIEVVNPIPQVTDVQIREYPQFYMVEISYEPRYGYGVLTHGSCCGEDSYNFFEVTNLNDYDDRQNPPIMEIRCYIKGIGYFHMRDKETDHIIILKKDCWSEGKVISSWESKDEINS